LRSLNPSFHITALLLTGPARLVNVDTGTEYAKISAPSRKSN